MSQPPNPPADPMSSLESPAGDHFPGQGGLGTFLLILGAGIGILAIIDRTTGLPFGMPRTWYTSPVLWYFFAFVSFVGGMRLLRPTVSHDGPHWRPEQRGQRFENIVVYTRDECHLCDQAKDVLQAHRSWLPEIEEVNIANDPELIAAYGEQIPVVEIDGQVRFRGRVNEVLLRRMIEATPPRTSTSESRS